MSVRVDWRQSVALTGTVIKYLAVAMLVPLGISFLYGEDTVVFLISIAIAITLGIALEQASDSHELGPREALLFVGLSWGAVAVIGAIPYVIAGYGTESALGEPVNALFESMSGFTTTGATVTNEISFARHSHALLMWRQLTQWLGGMGIIVLMVAILPEAAVNGAQLIESEAPGPELQKLTPKIAETARLLWLFYLALPFCISSFCSASITRATHRTWMRIMPSHTGSRRCPPAGSPPRPRASPTSHRPSSGSSSRSCSSPG